MSDNILFEIAGGRHYESEYDGRNDTYCSFCDCNLSEDQDHDSDCLMIEARKSLGAKWDIRLLGMEQLKAKQIEAQDPFMNCPICEQVVKKVGLKQHQRDSARCAIALRSSSCHADRDGDCNWEHCPQKVTYLVWCPLADKDPYF